MISQHSHSGTFCLHAKGSIEDTVQSAIDKHFIVYGLTEHCPRYQVCDLYPEEVHLNPSDLSVTFDSFVRRAVELRKHHRELQLIVGCETEYIRSSSTSELKSLLERHPAIDYLVGSVHHVNGHPIDFSEELTKKALSSCDDHLPTFLATYFDHQFQIIDNLHPEVIGHFDVIRLFLSDRTINFKDLVEVWEKITRNIEKAVSYGALFEINSAGFVKWGAPWPSKEIVSLILEKGGRFTISDDAHAPERVGQNYYALRDWLRTEFPLVNFDIWYLSRKVGVDERLGRKESWTRVEAVKLDQWQNHFFWEKNETFLFNST